MVKRHNRAPCRGEAPAEGTESSELPEASVPVRACGGNVPAEGTESMISSAMATSPVSCGGNARRRGRKVVNVLLEQAAEFLAEGTPGRRGRKDHFLHLAPGISTLLGRPRPGRGDGKSSDGCRAADKKQSWGGHARERGRKGVSVTHASIWLISLTYHWSICSGKLAHLGQKRSSFGVPPYFASSASLSE